MSVLYICIESVVLGGSGCFWNDTVVPFCSFSLGTLKKDSTCFPGPLLRSEGPLKQGGP